MPAAVHTERCSFALLTPSDMLLDSLEQSTAGRPFPLLLSLFYLRQHGLCLG